jgi:glycosyl transferase family 2
MLAPNALDTLSMALDRDSSIHIAFGHLDTVNDQGQNQQRNPWPGATFDWHAQIAHLNQLHYSSMMRREVLERSGGYRIRDWRAEDASFWTRVTSFGFRAAKVTDDATLIYRLRSDSKSRGEDGDGDWTAWFPWRLAGDPTTGLDMLRDKRQPNPLIVPFGAQGTPPAPLKAWPVHHHQHPLVSVIIPVGPGHAPYLIDALDSVQAQTFPFWEVIVVNDSGDELDTLGAPYARVVATTGRRGAGAARNVGLDAARAPLVVFLDADDLLTPRALETMLRAFVQSDGRYVYSDWLTLEDETRIDGPMAARTVEDYDQRKMLQGLRHAVTALVPAEWVTGVGGFDETLKGFEDWDLYCKLAVVGACGVRTAHPLLVYRRAAGLRTRTLLKPREHEDDPPAYTALGEQTAEAIYSRYAAQRQGDERIMPCGSCGGQSQVVADARSALDMLSLQTGGLLTAGAPIEGVTVRMEFIGGQEGEQNYIGKASGRVYRASRNPSGRFHDVDARDVEHFLNMELFRIVPPELLQAAARTDEPVMVPAEPQQAASRGRKR